MQPQRLLPLFGALLTLTAPLARTQTTTGPSGHWDGAIRTPDGAMEFQIDIAQKSEGKLAGAISIPSQSLRQLPLNVTAEGRALSFESRADQPFTGVLSDDGQSIAGEVTFAGFSLPYQLSRTGEADMEAPARLAAVPKQFEGSWEATVTNDGNMRLILKIMNQPDGTATASVINLDEGGLEIPVSAITGDGSKVTLGFRSVSGSYSGVLSEDARELAGTFTQGRVSAALTFRRAAASPK